MRIKFNSNTKGIEMSKRILSICCTILILILMSTPFGVRMVFFGSVSEETTEPETYFHSFFGAMPAESANMLPFDPVNNPQTIQVEENISFYYSYFSTMPIGYANFYPLITALLTLIILVLLLLGQMRDNRTLVGICAIGCILASGISWLIFSSFSAIGFVIFALHAIVCILQVEKKSQKIVTTPESELWKMK